MIGTLVGALWQVVAKAGSGGMGVVYRATNRVTGELVALKVMGAETATTERFWREAEILSELTHPAVVRYLGRGRTDSGQPFLVMEWLEGEDLESRLGRGALGVADTLAIARRATGALAAAHARGVVHRDLKPSNLFLVDGDPARVKLLDFGIAHDEIGTRRMTRTGAVLGTVGYMAPEQAGGAHEVDGRADLFSLGCVLYECLAGVPAFSGAQLVAVLAKVLREDPVPLASLRSDVPPQLDELISRLLSKQREKRPWTAGELAAKLETLDVATTAVVPTPPRLVRRGEQRLLSALIVDMGAGALDSVTLTPAEFAVDEEHVRGIAERYGGHASVLANHHVLVTVTTTDSAGDQALRAAACALELGEAYPRAAVALATGRAESTEHAPVGPVIERAAALLEGATGRVVIDELTARFAEARFEVRKAGDRLQLLRARTAAGEEDARRLLGKRTPCVGRRKELALLEATLEECIDESSPQVIVITAPAGTGKSRLRRELTRRLREQGTDVRVLGARAELVAAASSMALARQLVRAAIEAPEGAWQAVLGAHIDARVDAVVAPGARGITREFLRELLGVASDAPPSAAMRAARNDPRVMAEWFEQSFVALLSGEAHNAPLLVVLDDLHWADEASLRYVDTVLDQAPMMVLGLGRPDEAARFAELGARANRQDIRLGPLGNKAASQLVHAALGDDVDDATTRRIVARAEGNAFYLEELIRHVAETGSDDLPETVLAMAASRLARLEPEARRVLRAASVFGETFHDGAVAALLGESAKPDETREWLGALVDRELLTEQRESRFAGERELAFRHALLREAAYAMLTDADRVTGHRLAGEWLESAGARDPAVLAMHFERGDASERAVPYLVAATHAAFVGADAASAQTLGERGLALGATGTERIQLLLDLGQVLSLSDPAAAIPYALEAMPLTERGSDMWFLATVGPILLESLTGKFEHSPGALQALADPDLVLAPTGPCAKALYYLFMGLAISGLHDMAHTTFSRIEALARAEDADRACIGWVDIARTVNAVWYTHDLAAATDAAERALENFGEIRDDFASMNALLHQCAAVAVCGAVERTQDVAARVASFARRSGSRVWAKTSQVYVTEAGWDRVPFEQVERELRPMLDIAYAHVRREARAIRAHAAAVAGRVDQLELARGRRALSARAALELQSGDLESALEHAETAARAESHGAQTHAVALVTRAEALHALGRVDEARTAIEEAELYVLAVGSGLEPELRDAWLGRHFCARTLRLAREWTADAPARALQPSDANSAGV